jgi:hypothetical protein
LLDVIGSSVTDILMLLAYRGLTMVYGCYVRGRRILATSNVIVIATSPVTVWLARRLRYCFVAEERVYCFVVDERV